MINLKRCNYFTGDPSDIGYSINKIVNFLENFNYNSLLITTPRINNFDAPKIRKASTPLIHFLKNQKTFENFQQFCQILNEPGNLFRVNLLIFDFMHLEKSEISDYKKEIDKLGIDHIIAASEYHYILDEDINDFHVRREYKDLQKSEVWVTDNITGQVSSLDSLEISYKRDIKINNLFGDVK
jgi:hypothetical protein